MKHLTIYKMFNSYVNYSYFIFTCQQITDTSGCIVIIGSSPITGKCVAVDI